MTLMRQKGVKLYAPITQLAHGLFPAPLVVDLRRLKARHTKYLPQYQRPMVVNPCFCGEMMTRGEQCFER